MYPRTQVSYARSLSNLPERVLSHPQPASLQEEALCKKIDTDRIYAFMMHINTVDYLIFRIPHTVWYIHFTLKLFFYCLKSQSTTSLPNIAVQHPIQSNPIQSKASKQTIQSKQSNKIESNQSCPSLAET